MKNRKLVAILTLLCFMFTLMPAAAMAADNQDTVILKIGSADVYKNSEKITTDVVPAIVDGRTLVPVRVIIEAMDGAVDWDEATRTVTITIDGKVLKLVIDQEIAGFGTGAKIIESRTMVPIRYISEYVGFTVKWVEATQQVIITRAADEAAETYTVSFDLNTGSEGVFKTVTVKAGQTVEKPDVEYKSGRVFHGWYTNDEGKGDVFDFSTPIYSDVTLYGYWSAVSYGGGGGHSHNYTTVTPATCCADGLAKCSCGATTVIPATGTHSLDANYYCSGCQMYYVSKSEQLKAVIENENITVAVINLADGEYTTNFKIAGGKNITMIGSEKVVLAGQIASTSSTAGTLTLQGLTVNVDSNINDSTGISQTGKSAIAIWGNQTVVCEDVTFNMSLQDSSAISAWWDTNEGTTIKCYDCTFNCNGQRPIRATGNVTVEGCTFNDPYRYAVQLTAKTSTASLMGKAIINFKNNTIVNGENGKAFVYGIQLEGETYGCSDLIITGEKNKIVNGGTDSTMYYCECGKVKHETITWNVEAEPEHAVKINSDAALDTALKNGDTVITLEPGTYKMPASAKGKTFTVNGKDAEKTIIEVVPAGQGEANGQLDYNLDGSTVTFNNVTIETNSQLYAGYARLSATYNNCVIQNTYNLGTGTSQFNDCEINISNEYLRVGGATIATFNKCTFNTDGRAILVFQDGTSVSQTVTVKNCTFNATAAANTWNGIHVAAVSIDGTNGTYVVNLEGTNTVDSDFNGLWQIKAGEANVTVNE